VGFYSYQNTRKETEGVRNLRHSYAVEIRPEVENIVKLKKKKERGMRRIPSSHGNRRLRQDKVIENQGKTGSVM
jgi:hypothetical protein